MRLMILLCLMALPASAESWISYGRSGGIAGLFVNLSISSEGHVEYRAKRTPFRTGTLSEAEMQALRDAIPSPIPPGHSPKPAIPDGIHYSLQVGAERSVWSTGAPMPLELGPLVEQLEVLVSRFED